MVDRLLTTGPLSRKYIVPLPWALYALGLQSVDRVRPQGPVVASAYIDVAMYELLIQSQH